MRLLGQLCLLGAFVGSGFAAFTCLVGSHRKWQGLHRIGQLTAIGSVVALSGTIGILAHALIVKDFSYRYVADYSSWLLAWYYSLSALWVGQAGSLLLWSWVLGILALAFFFFPVRTLQGSGTARSVC